MNIKKTSIFIWTMISGYILLSPIAAFADAWEPDIGRRDATLFVTHILIPVILPVIVAIVISIIIIKVIKKKKEKNESKQQNESKEDIQDENAEEYQTQEIKDNSDEQETT